VRLQVSPKSATAQGRRWDEAGTAAASALARAGAGASDSASSPGFSGSRSSCASIRPSVALCRHAVRGWSWRSDRGFLERASGPGIGGSIFFSSGHPVPGSVALWRSGRDDRSWALWPSPLGVASWSGHPIPGSVALWRSLRGDLGVALWRCGDLGVAIWAWHARPLLWAWLYRGFCGKGRGPLRGPTALPSPEHALTKGPPAYEPRGPHAPPLAL